MKRLNMVLLIALVLAFLPAQALAAPEAPTAANAHWRQSGLVVVDTPSGPDKTTTSTGWVDIPGMQGSFSPRYTSDVAITFCAEADVTNNKRMFVRALIDGQGTSPGDVMFAAGWNMDTHCFTFVKNGVAPSSHNVSVQWHTDSGGEAHVADRSLHITFAKSDADDLRLLAVAAPSGPTQVHTGGWVDIPNMGGNINLPAASDLAITFSGEAWTTNNKRMFVRALVDGGTTSPGDQVLVVGGNNGTRSITFVKQNVAAGNHNVRIQWLVDSGGNGNLGDRSLKVVSVRRFGSKYAGRLMTGLDSGDISTTSTGWVDMPNMSGDIHVPATGVMAINFSAAVWAGTGKRVFVRALVDGQPTSPGDIVIVTGPWTGTYAFAFVKKNVTAGKHTVKIQWHTDASSTAAVGDRSLAAYTYGYGTGISISYAVKVKGFSTWVLGRDGSSAGTSGQNRPLEAVTLDLVNPPPGATIRYRVHMQGQGWMAWVNENQTAGLPGSGMRMEAIEVQLINWPSDWQLQYDAHVQSYGWQGWIDAPFTAGTVGQGLRVESLRFQVAPDGIIQEIIYDVHSQQVGWVGWRHQGDLAGTVAQSRRIEALVAGLTGFSIPPWVEYQVWIQGQGWTTWIPGSVVAGTTGQSRRIEALRVRLTSAPAGMQVCYQAYMQGQGWNAWVCDGQTAGAPGQSLRIEAIRMRLQ